MTKERRAALTLIRRPRSGIRSPGKLPGGSGVVGALKAEQSFLCRRGVACSLRKGHGGVFGEERIVKTGCGKGWRSDR